MSLLNTPEKGLVKPPALIWLPAKTDMYLIGVPRPEIVNGIPGRS